MTAGIDFRSLNPGRNFSPTVNAFYSNGVNRPDFFRANARAMFGEGADTFAGATRNNNPVLEAWVHTLDEGNGFFPTSNTTTLSAGVGTGDATIPLVSVTGFAASGHAMIENEIVAYTSIVGSSLSGVTRGQLGTTAAAHLSGAGVKAQLGPYGSRIQYAQTTALVSAVTDRGQGLSGAARSIRGDAIGGAFFGRLDAGGVGDSVWGIYPEAIRGEGTLGVGSVWGAEIATVQFAGDQVVAKRGGTPYYQGFTGQTIGAMIQNCAGNTNGYNADNPLVVALGGNPYWRGLVFEAGSIAGVSGAKPEAVMMPEDYTVTWYSPDNVRAFNLFSTITAGAYAQELLVSEFGLIHRTMAGGTLFQAAYVANSVNYVSVVGGATGVGALVQAVGADAAVDLTVKAKGAGKLRAIFPGTYADDTAAAAAGVAIGEAYRKTGGTVAWRQV